MKTKYFSLLAAATLIFLVGCVHYTGLQQAQGPQSPSSQTANNVRMQLTLSYGAAISNAGPYRAVQTVYDIGNSEWSILPEE